MSRPTRFAAAVMAAALIVGIQVGTAPPAPAEAAPEGCIPVAVLTLRGSGEANLKASTTSNAGSNHKYGTSQLVTNGWEGKHISGMLNEFAKIFYSSGFEADSVPVIGVGPADSTTTLGYPAIPAWLEVFMALNESATSGADAAMNIMAEMKTGARDGCPTQTKFILAGYSQGVIAARMAAQMNPTDVIGVVSVGDPYQKPDAAGNEGTGSGGNGFMRWNYPRLKGQMDTFYDLGAEKAAVCHDGDQICDFRWGTAHKFVNGDNADHESYYTSTHPSEAKNKSKQIADIAHRLWTDAQSPSAPSTASADVVFLVDTTGSMWPYIDQAVATAETVASATLSSAPGSRVGLVEYRDHGDAFVARTVVSLTTNFGSLTAGLSTLYADGGGDAPEAVFSGIVESINQPWRSDAARSIIVIADAPAHNPEPVTGYTSEQIAGYLAAGSAPPSPAPVPDDGYPSSDISRTPLGQELSMMQVSAVSLASTLRLSTPTSLATTAGTGPAIPISLYAASAYGGLDDLSGIAEGSGGRVLPMESADDLADAIGQAIEETTEAPVAVVTSSSPAIAGMDVLISAVGSSSSDSDLTYEFDLDGNGTFETSSPAGTVTTRFASAATYTVSARVTDSRSRSGVSTTQVVVASAEAADPVDLNAPGITVTSDGSVIQGDDLGVTVSGGTPEEYLLVPGNGDIWETPPAFSAPMPGTWNTDGLPIPVTVLAGTYRLVVGATEGVWGTSSVEILSNGSSPAGTLTLSAITVKQGGSIVVSGSGLAGPGSAEVWLHSTPVKLGSAPVSAAGAFSVSVVIPASTTPAQHSIVINYGGATLTAPITVTAAAAAAAAAGAQSAANGVSALQVTGPTTPVLLIAGIGLFLILVGVLAVRVRASRVTE